MKYLKGNSLNKNFSLIEEAARFIEGTSHEMLFFFDAASHFNMKFDDSFIEESKSLRSLYKDVHDAVRWHYWKSWALSEFPGNGLIFLRESGWLDLFPEIAVNIGVMQNPKTHPEGDVFNHLVLSVNVAAEIAEREDLDDEDRFVLLFAALCHDFGKYENQENHEKLGVYPASRFLASIGAPHNVTSRVLKLVEFHGSEYQFQGRRIEREEITEDYVSILEAHLMPAGIPELIMLNEADVNGRMDETGKLVKHSYNDRIFPGYRKILNIYQSIGKVGFTTANLINMVNSDIVKIDDVKPGFSQNEFIKRMNALIREGYVLENEAETMAGFIFSVKYREAVDYCATLDYRDRKRFVDYMNENNVDLDTLLLRGESGIKEILNHSEL